MPRGPDHAAPYFTDVPVPPARPDGVNPVDEVPLQVVPPLDEEEDPEEGDSEEEDPKEEDLE